MDAIANICGYITASSTVKLPLHDLIGMRYSYRMNLKEILQRIDDRLAGNGGERTVSDRAASLGAGLGADTIRNWRRSVRDGNTKAGANADSIRKIALYLNVNESWLMRGVGSPTANASEDLMISLEPLDEIGRQELKDYFEFLLKRRSRSLDSPQK